MNTDLKKQYDFPQDCTVNDILDVFDEDPESLDADNVTVARHTIARLRGILKLADTLGVEVVTYSDVNALRSLTAKIENALDEEVL